MTARTKSTPVQRPKRVHHPRPLNEGYQPKTVQNGYQPTTGQGAPANPPNKGSDGKKRLIDECVVLEKLFHND